MSSALRRACPAMVAAAATGLTACEGVQSMLAAEGPEAGRVALLAVIMFVGAGVILVVVALMTSMALFGPEALRRRLRSPALVIGGGIVVPVVTLTALLAYGLLVMQSGDSTASRSIGTGDRPLRLAVVGERWWWRVIYQEADGRSFETANEIRIPVGRAVRIDLTTADVIHSFWVPKLAGKVDMIPGRTNSIHIVAENPGISRGQCAEYCGGAHALMAFQVVALTEADFTLWLETASGPAREPTNELEQRGRDLFLASGCGGCHSVRGTEADGVIGPDLTHVGGRLSIAAATLSADRDSLARWIADNQHIKPDNLMPPFRIFNRHELNALATYLKSLR